MDYKKRKGNEMINKDIYYSMLCCETSVLQVSNEINISYYNSLYSDDTYRICVGKIIPLSDVSYWGVAEGAGI